MFTLKNKGLGEAGKGGPDRVRSEDGSLFR